MAFTVSGQCKVIDQSIIPITSPEQSLQLKWTEYHTSTLKACLKNILHSPFILQNTKPFFTRAVKMNFGMERQLNQDQKRSFMSALQVNLALIKNTVWVGGAVGMSSMYGTS